jgi:hypothetical protein
MLLRRPVPQRPDHAYARGSLRSTTGYSGLAKL